jgi:hypothetical protein
MSLPHGFLDWSAADRAVPDTYLSRQIVLAEDWDGEVVQKSRTGEPHA